MNLKPYPIPFTDITGQEYKDSGIEWLGKVPERWEVKRLKWIARLEYGSSLSEEARETARFVESAHQARSGKRTPPLI